MGSTKAADRLWQTLKCRDRAYRVATSRMLFWRGGVAKANSHADRMNDAFQRRYNHVLMSVVF